MVNPRSEIIRPVLRRLSDPPRSDDFGLKMLFQDNELVVQIEEMFEKLEPGISSKHCIYRIPEKIRNLNEQAYSPRVISIGPFHHKTNERLKSMDTIKTKYFQKLIAWSDISLREYVQLVNDLEERAQEYYAETIRMSKNDFVSMLLIDACFIIELLLRFYYIDPVEDDGYLLSTPWLRSDVRLDLMLLENQIPFSLLDELYVQATRYFDVISLKALALHFFNEYNINYIDEDCRMPSHFTDLVLIMYQPDIPRLIPRYGRICNQKLPFIHSATELHEAGVKFRASKTKHLFDVRFNRGVLTIPCFSLNQHTEIFLRNLMALELCHYPKKTYVIDYILFMDYLIDTSHDIKFLSKKGIIMNGLSESTVAADLFNSLCKNVTVDGHDFYLLSIYMKLNAYYKEPVHKWKAILKHDYLSTPWKTASTIAAIVLLALTLTQTICSILSLTSFK